MQHSPYCIVIKTNSNKMKTIGELRALIELADEPNEMLYGHISKRIISYGKGAMPLLREALIASRQCVVRDRIAQLISSIEQQETIIQLNQWKEKKCRDLLEPYIILCKQRYPRLDWNVFMFQVVAIVEQITQELNPDLTPLEQVKVLNHVLYDVNHFKGDSLSIKKPEQYYLNNVLETRNGNPISMGILYIIIAQRLQIPIYGVNIPRHFILAFTDGKTEQPRLENVLFYLNPFNKGAIFTRNEIMIYLKQLNIKPERKFFEPSSNQNIIRNLLRTLMEAHSEIGNSTQVDELRPLLESIDN